MKSVPALPDSAPSHFRPETQEWWRTVVRDWPLDDHHLKLLQLAAEAWDQVQAAREVIAQEGITYTDRFGAPRTHPAVAIERDARLAFARLLNQLDLDATPEPTARSLRGRRR